MKQIYEKQNQPFLHVLVLVVVVQLGGYVPAQEVTNISVYNPKSGNSYLGGFCVKWEHQSQKSWLEGCVRVQFGCGLSTNQITIAAINKHLIVCGPPDNKNKKVSLTG
jgi:hypothetical protein